MRTKIVATIGPASNSKEKLRQLVEAGVSVFRLNFSHGSAADFVRIINDIREVEKELDKPITIMQDLSGPKIRLGVVQEKTIQVTKGMQLLLGLSDQRTDEMPFLPFDHPEILETLEPGDRMVLADGGLQFTVQQSRPDGLVLLEANNSGIVTSRKGLALPGKATKVRALTEKDKKDLSDGLALGVDAVAISYVQTADDVREAKQLIAASGRRVPVVVKLERQNAVDNLDEILKETDVIMVARGDLGVEVDMEEVPVLQKQFIHKCNVAAKPVITATQMLDSMIRNPRPTRAEASDVANAIIDGTDAIMLSGETAAGKYPIEAVGTMVRIATYIEAHQLHDNTQLLQQEAVRNATVRTVANAVSYSCCQMARDLNANAIITPSNSGTTARMVARFRPDCPIIAPTPSEHAYHQLGLSYGVVPAHMGVSGDTDELINTAVEAAQQTDLIKTGDVVIISAGVPTGVSGTTNLIKAHIVGNVLLRGIGVGSGCASGNVCTVNTLSDLESDFKDGDVIVTKMTSSEMLPYMRRASAVVVESTNPECHAVVACQAMGIPMMMDRTYQAVHMLKSGMMITVDADEGFIYNGIKA